MELQVTFEELVELHHGALYRFAMSLTRREDSACDLVQDTFLAWARKGSELRDKTKAKAWLFTTLHRRFLESQRRTLRFPHVEIDEADLELNEVDSDAVNRLDGQMLIEMVAGLDQQFRAAVALFYLEDYTYPEIAEILKVPLGTVKSRIARGIAELKRRINAQSGRHAL